MVGVRQAASRTNSEKSQDEDDGGQANGNDL
jgi:hypothetical protein